MDDNLVTIDAANTASSPPAKRGRRRKDEKPTPNRDDLVKAVLEIEARDGPGSLSMRKLATEVGVSARLLYTMVKNKEELYELAVNSLLAQWKVPDKDLSWQVCFTALTKTSLEHCIKYPELARQALRYSLENKYPKNAEPLLKVLASCFAQAGLNPNEARQVQMLFNALLLGALELTRDYQNDEQTKLISGFYSAADTAFAHILKGVRLG